MPQDNYIYINGELLPATRASVPVLDRGYLYGEGLFETMRSWNGRVFALDRHLRRLLSSAADLGLALGVGEDGLADAITRTLQANHLTDAYVRLTVSQRCDEPGVASRATGRFSVSVIARPHHGPTTRSDCLSVMTLAANTAPPPDLARHKTLSYFTFVRARAAAAAAQVDEALLLNAAAEVTEASTANVFAVIGDRLVTPPVACGLLPGITREIILELAQSAGLDIAQRAVASDQIGACSELFLTNSIIGLQPAGWINGTPLGDAPGPVCRALAAAYEGAVTAATSI